MSVQKHSICCRSPYLDNGPVSVLSTLLNTGQGGAELNSADKSILYFRLLLSDNIFTYGNIKPYAIDSRQTSGNQTVEVTNRQLSDLLVYLRFAAIYNSDSMSGVREETKVSDQEYEAICSLATALQEELGKYSNEKLAAVLFCPESKEVEITLPQEVVTEALQVLEQHESRYFHITPFRDAKRVFE